MIEVFYSFAPEDDALQQQLEKHLAGMKGILTGWHHRRVTPGQEWRGVVDERLRSAQVVLLLVSADFLASDYCWDVEVSRALARHRADEALVIPVLLRACDWKRAPFADLEALPGNSKPVTSWANQDEAWASVAEGIRDALGTMSRRAPPERAVLLDARRDGKAPDVRRRRMLLLAAAAAVPIGAGIAYGLAKPAVPPALPPPIASVPSAAPAPPATVRMAFIHLPAGNEHAKVHQWPAMNAPPEPQTEKGLPNDTRVVVLEPRFVTAAGTSHGWWCLIRYPAPLGEARGWINNNKNMLVFDDLPPEAPRCGLPGPAESPTTDAGQ